MEKILIPDRSAFDNLSILGEGTADVECIFSYIWRLARHYNVTVGRIMAGRFATYNESCARARTLIRGAQFETNGYKGLIGSGVGAKVCEALSVIVGVRLVVTTLRRLHCALSTTRLFQFHARWCGICIQGDTHPYLRLYWCFPQVDTCAIHGIKLLTKCVSCDHTIPIFDPRAKKLECRHCHSPLSTEGPKIHDPIGTERASIIRRFVGKCNCGTLPLTTEGLHGALCRLAGKNSRVPAWRALGVTKSSWSGWMKKGKSPSAAMFIDICLRLNVDIVDLIEGLEVYPTPCLSDPSGNLATWNRGKKRRSPRTYSADQLQERVAAFLPQSPALSIGQIADALEVGVRDLYRLAPEQCHEITKKKRLESHSEHQRRAESRKQQIQIIFRELIRSGITPSNRNVGMRLAKSGILRDKELRAYLRTLRGIRTS